MASRSNHSLPSTSKSTIPTNSFLNSISKLFHGMSKYEDESLLTLAKSYIPIVTLQIKAIERMREIQKAIKLDPASGSELSLEDAFIVELMDWFKKTFFCWVDTPECNFCAGPTKFVYSSISHLGVNIEMYLCTLCDTETEFPRYDDLKVLLKTRRGRCGEWAKCFALFCRAMNYDTRLVISTTDHVWTEIYSFDLKRWVHCDPCETAIDTPLMYETGWGHKLSYVIAYSRDDVQDVTWKYSCDHEAVMSRRDQCSESDLVSTLMSLRNEKFISIGNERKKFLQKRLCVELVDMMNKREVKDCEKVGRVSGSVAWRTERKEIGSAHIWEIGDKENITIQYNTSSDSYELIEITGHVLKSIQGWTNGVYEVENVKRKVENDWKMVYLARTEKSTRAKISWKVRAINSKKISEIHIMTSSHIFYNGKVTWTLYCKDEALEIPKSSEPSFILKNLKDLTEFTLSAELSGGGGDTAWQHSQIFRQEIDSNNFPLQITVTFKS